MKRKLMNVCWLFVGIVTLGLFQNFSPASEPASSSSDPNYQCSDQDRFFAENKAKTTEAKASGGTMQMACWTQADLLNNPQNHLHGDLQQPLKFEIITQGVPTSKNTTYGYWPQTAGFGQPEEGAYSTFKGATDGSDPSQLVTSSGVKKFTMIWGNRCSHMANQSSDDCFGAINYKTQRFQIPDTANPGSPSQFYNFFFSSVSRADACTKAQAMAVAGASREETLAVLPLKDGHPSLAIYGTDLAGHALSPNDPKDAAALIAQFGSAALEIYKKPENFNSGKWVTDFCYIPTLRDSATAAGGPYSDMYKFTAGIVFDWETDDERTAPQAAAFFTDIRATISHINQTLGRTNFPLILINDPVNGSGEAAGLGKLARKETADGAFSRQIVAAMDAVEIFVQAPTESYCKYKGTTAWSQLSEQISDWGLNPQSPNTDFRHFMIGYSVASGANLAREVRHLVDQYGFFYIQPQNPFIRQFSCDTSDASNPPGRASIARHMKDLFDLPTPVNQNPVLNTQLSDALVPINTSVGLHWFVQSDTNTATGQAQVHNCALQGPGLAPIVANYGSAATPPLQVPSTYTLSCDGLSPVSKTVLIDLAEFNISATSWTQSGSALTVQKMDSTDVSMNETATSGAHGIHKYLNLPSGYLTSDTYTLQIVAEPDGAAGNNSIHLQMIDESDREASGGLDCNLDGVVNHNPKTKLGAHASGLLASVKYAKGITTCNLTLRPNAGVGQSSLKLFLNLANEAGAYKYLGNPARGIRIHSITLNKVIN